MRRRFAFAFVMAVIGMVSDAVPCSGGQMPAWRIVGIPESAKMSSGSVSAARWIWTKASARPNQVVYFRYRFESGDITKGDIKPFLNCRADDFFSASYLNGFKFEFKDFCKYLRKGENVLALAVSNGVASAAVIFHGVCRGPDGKRRVLSSNASVKCSTSLKEGWMALGFDDSSWEASREIGDATTAPWNTTEALVRYCMSEEEWAAYRSNIERAIGGVPAGLADEPEPSARIVYRGWMPKIDINGRDFEPVVSRMMHLGASAYQDSAALKLNSLGFPITCISARGDEIWRDDGVYDFSVVDFAARRLLTIAPTTHIELSLRLDECKWWCAAHPNETVGYAMGVVNPSGDIGHCVVRPSVASVTFRRDVARLVAAFGEFVRREPWGRRVVAVRVGYGIYGEWHSFGMHDEPDTGVAMTTRFRGWLRDRYGTDAALKAAWNAPSVTFASVAPPTSSERRANSLVLDPHTHRKTLDFYECMASTTADLLLDIARNVKAALPGRIVGAYYGYVFDLTPPEGATVLLDKVLASSYVDYLVNPPTYSAAMRRAGGAFAPRLIPSTFHRYGKLALLEDDSRYHHLRTVRGLKDEHITTTPAESRAVVMRNYFNSIFDGIGYQTLDPAPGSEYAFNSFDNPDVLEALYDAMRISRLVGDPETDSRNDLAVVIDYRGRLRLNSRCNRDVRMHERYRHIQDIMYRTGIPFDVMTLDDYLAGRDYPHVLFVNPVEADADLMARAFAKAGDGAMCIDSSPCTAEDMRDRLVAAGLHAWTAPGSCLRRHGRFFMFHTGTIGRHRILLPHGASGARSLVTERTYSGSRIVLEAKDSLTDLFELL